MHRFAEAKNIAESIMNLDKSIIDTQQIALDARAIGLACSTYISVLPGSETVDLKQLDQIIDDSSASQAPLERHVREAAKSAIRTIYKQSVLEKQKAELIKKKASKDLTSG